MRAEVADRIDRLLDRLSCEGNTLLAAITVVEVVRGFSGASPDDLAVFTACEIQARRIEAEGRVLNFDEVAEAIRRWSGAIEFDEPFSSWRRWRTRAPP